MKLRAPLLLGWHAVRWLTGGARFWRGDGPLNAFLQAYEADGIRPLTPDERTHLPSWLACTACGLCDLACPDDKTPMLAVAGMQRDIPRHAHYASHAAAMGECGECDDCEAICPTGVPILDVAAFVASASD